MYSEDDLIPISALQHYLYCPRQCALIHLERVWEENRFTAEGRVMHENAHEGRDEHRPGIKITRGMSVSSREYGLSGQCDVVEYHDDGNVIPVEYKRGKPKSHSADEVQLCAQALCLREMCQIDEGHVSFGYLFYGKTRRRTDVVFSEELIDLTLQTARQVHELFHDLQTPPAEYERRKCDACSLIEICKPRTMNRKNGAQTWFEQSLESDNIPDQS